MDRLTTYRRIIKQVLEKHTQIKYSHGHIERIAISDEERDSYILLSIGWDKARRIHTVVFHLRIHNGKIWVEDDWTANGIANELMEAGISQEEIVLGFHSAEKRPLTDFAIA